MAEGVKKFLSFLPFLFECRFIGKFAFKVILDVLGRVCEYFLGEIAREEGKKGGGFYTPERVVRTIVEVILPYKGKIFDPACGASRHFAAEIDVRRN